MQMPKYIQDFLVYLTAIKGKSQRTRKEYEYDLLLFIRFNVAVRNDLPTDHLQAIDVSRFTIEDIQQITLEDLYSFLEYCELVRGNGAASRSRKVATLKSFFHYLKAKRRLITDNPTDELEAPKISKKQPIYMNMNESLQFLEGLSFSRHYERDYCMMTWMLNLGIRVSELCSLDINSVHNDILTVRGKGDKERNLYLNEQCLATLKSYLSVRPAMLKDENQPALFISQQGTRLTRQSLSKLVRKINDKSGLNKTKLSPHKLRHTSATLLYKSGADIRSLQQILGHSNISTTQIYTHVENKEIQRVISEHPLNKL
ncbi:MAG: tyrosine recombinase XerC [Kurthia sp.]|nr:tyrosine recombinase XerC [Candidatus Kurthia equi]